MGTSERVHWSLENMHLIIEIGPFISISFSKHGFAKMETKINFFNTNKDVAVSADISAKFFEVFINDVNFTLVSAPRPPWTV